MINQNEYPQYYQKYIDNVGEKSVMQLLEAQVQEVRETFGSIPNDKGDYAYAGGKWSVKELFGHILDTERIMAYRALCIARGEKGPLPGYEQDDYVRGAEFCNRSLADMLEEFEYVRRANLILFNSLSEDALIKTGKANNNNVSVRALMYVIAGHAAHHIKILKEKYL